MFFENLYFFGLYVSLGLIDILIFVLLLLSPRYLHLAFKFIPVLHLVTNLFLKTLLLSDKPTHEKIFPLILMGKVKIYPNPTPEQFHRYKKKIKRKHIRGPNNNFNVSKYSLFVRFVGQVCYAARRGRQDLTGCGWWRVQSSFCTIFTPVVTIRGWRH